MPVTVCLSCHVMALVMFSSCHVCAVFVFWGGPCLSRFLFGMFCSAAAFLVLSRTILSILSHASGAGPLSKC